MILAGPWLGEFGWEVAVWVPILRAKKADIVVCQTDHNYLYEDFAKTIINYDKKGKPDRWLCNGKKPVMPKWIKDAHPDTRLCRPRQGKIYTWPKKYKKYGNEGIGYDLVIHARAEKKYGQHKWNWPDHKYTQLVQMLGVKTCSIGTKAHHIPETDDLRGIPLEELCTILKNSKVILSPSSGPAHLALLCGCPAVVMTDNKYQKSVGGTNRDRYKKFWNPFKVKVSVVDKYNWQPPLKTVLKKLKKYL